jgi:hypothetical protein
VDVGQQVIPSLRWSSAELNHDSALFRIHFAAAPAATGFNSPMRH